MSEFKGTMDEIVQNGANGVHTKKGICVALEYLKIRLNALKSIDLKTLKDE
jgi:hypothetical protein